MKTYLKIKIKSLAEEARIIKREERRWWKLVGIREIRENNRTPREKKIYKKDHPLILGLREHRIHEVRAECRSANIAYGYLRGRAYKQIENKCYEQPNWERIADIIRKFNYKTFPNMHTAEGRKAAVEQLKAWAGRPLIETKEELVDHMLHQKSA